MLIQLTIGSVAILASMAIMIGFITPALALVRGVEKRFKVKRVGFGQFFAMVSAAVVLVLVANTICVWMWAILFWIMGIFDTLEEAVYFGIVSFTTVGYGDVVVDRDWRILSGFVAVNGLLAFGIFTAFLIEIIRELSARSVRGR